MATISLVRQGPFSTAMLNLEECRIRPANKERPVSGKIKKTAES